MSGDWSHTMPFGERQGLAIARGATVRIELVGVACQIAGQTLRIGRKTGLMPGRLK